MRQDVYPFHLLSVTYSKIDTCKAKKIVRFILICEDSQKSNASLDILHSKNTLQIMINLLFSSQYPPYRNQFPTESSHDNYIMSLQKPYILRNDKTRKSDRLISTVHAIYRYIPFHIFIISHSSTSDTQESCTL